MKLSTKARYALEGMLYIAAQQPGALVNTRERRRKPDGTDKREGNV